MLRIIRELIEFKPKQSQTNISEALKYISNAMKKKVILFILSDFMDVNYEQNLKIVSNKHDVTGIRIYDKYDVAFPNVGLISMQDAETGKVQWINTASKKTRRAYEQNYREYIDYFEKAFSHSGAGVISSRLDENYVKKLLGYFKRKAS